MNVDFGDEDFYCQPAKKQSREDDRKPAAVMVDTPSSCSPAATNDARPSARVLLEVDSAKSMLESHIRCKKCRGPVLVTFPTICIASGIRIECTNKIMCKFVDLTPPACAGMAEMNLASDELPRNNIFYAANILFVVGSMASGDGGKEAERTLGFLGLPNSSSMEKRSFPGLERRISDVIHELTEDILSENRQRAVELHYDGLRHTNGELLYDMWLEKRLDDPSLYPVLIASADMAWQKRSSGNRYDSNSGFAVLVEAKTRKPIAIRRKRSD